MTGANAPSTGPRLRVVSYNVHTLRDDRAALAAVVRELAPDVLLVQEAPRRFRWRQRCADLARAFGLVVAVGGQPACGNLILTGLRVRVTETWCVRFPLTPGRHLRGAAFARCAVGGTDPVRFVAAGSHLGTDPSERPGHARRLADALARVDDPVVVGADLNDEPGSPSWEAIADGRIDVGEGTGAGTAPAAPRAGPRRRIDTVFIDPGWAVLSYAVPDTPDVRRASDHLPVVVDLRVPTRVHPPRQP